MLPGNTLALGKALALVLIASLAAVPRVNAQVSAQAPATALSAKPVPLPAIRNPPGDIPDSQVFIDYLSPLGFSMKVPEGWAKRTSADGASFSSRYNAIDVSVTQASAAPTRASARLNQVAALLDAPAATTLSKVEAVRMPAGPAVRIAYASNSAANPVTGKAIRLEDENTCSGTTASWRR